MQTKICPGMSANENLRSCQGNLLQRTIISFLMEVPSLCSSGASQSHTNQSFESGLQMLKTQI